MAGCLSHLTRKLGRKLTASVFSSRSAADLNQKWRVLPFNDFNYLEKVISPHFSETLTIASDNASKFQVVCALYGIIGLCGLKILCNDCIFFSMFTICVHGGGIKLLLWLSFLSNVRSVRLINLVVYQVNC